MSDVSDSSSFNLGLANIASSNYGPTAAASQANTNAQTALTQEQTQGAAIGNQNARLQFQLFRNGMNHLMDFSGQNGPSLDQQKQSRASKAALRIQDVALRPQDAAALMIRQESPRLLHYPLHYPVARPGLLPQMSLGSRRLIKHSSKVNLRNNIT